MLVAFVQLNLGDHSAYSITKNTQIKAKRSRENIFLNHLQAILKN